MGICETRWTQSFGGAMDEPRYVDDAATAYRVLEVTPSPLPAECASRAADLSAEMYAHAERIRRRESLEALLSRGRGHPAE